jgi:hypothetical protein
MTLTRKELRQLAIAGAQARMNELDAQRMALLREFPELESSPARIRRAIRRRTRRFTAAQRRAISQRMKRFWAARRKNGKAA